MKICAATGNAGKLRELRRILEAQGHEVVSQKELGITIEPDETGTTFAENALIKAETICKASGLPTIADDSGLCVDALGGAPGVYSARYCGHHGDDEANNDKLLDAMKEVPEEKRGAKFVSAVCCGTRPTSWPPCGPVPRQCPPLPRSCGTSEPRKTQKCLTAVVGGQAFFMESSSVTGGSS